MKKIKYFAIMLLIPMILAVAGCSGKKKAVKYYDSDFISALEQGLQNRWNYTDTIKDTSNIKRSEYTKMVNEELNSVEDYKNKKFKNDNLHEEALEYINALHQQKAAISSYSDSSFPVKWSNSYNKRTDVLIKINKIHKLSFDSKYDSYWTEITRNGSSVENKSKREQQISTLIKHIKFKLSKNEDGFKTYDANVKNTTDYSFKTFLINVKLLNNKGVVVDTQPVSVENWSKKQTNQLEFETDKDFSRYKIVKDFIE
ncbi:FxLYD domain-containing protein [Lactobacillus sp. ESL0680]|uniref:FxLYD domain-containing protein n=1 Tax=Lactobacillus sp. ESL0680 TaxID=2983210 RepID=UPI0023F65836|nr:FxLYD domain-containing protein [Lactobacillus sp. ESL0680]WEV39237.1 FxLYD domain-containing protein [Lactobacillus sp. ESL0680]